MRAIYAVSFSFPQGTAADDVLEVAGGWFSRGQAPGEVRSSWAPGRRSYPLPESTHSLDVEVLESDEGRLWHGAWRHPYATDPDLYLLSDVEIGVTDSEVTAYLVIRAGWAKAKVAPPRFEMRAPRLARTMVERFAIRDGEHPLTATARVLDASAVPRFIEDVLLDIDRTRPVVFVADDSRVMGPNLDPDALARELAGLAHVYTSLYARPGWELDRRLGRLGCRDGGVRIWWPGLTLGDNPYRHPLLTGHALRHWQGFAKPEALLFRRISTAAAMNAAPLSHARLRRAGRLAQVEAASDAEARELLAYAIDENERLAADLKASIEDREELELERDELRDELALAENDNERMKRNFAEALAAGGEPAAEVDAEAEDGTPRLRSVRDAVDAAAGRSPHLAFADRAFESADESPFESPEDIFDDLMKLERLASLWARPGGIGGMDLGQKATELGLDWKADVSQTAKTKHDRRYTFTWNGEKRTMGPHVRLGSGSGAGHIARIYLDKHEPADPAERKLIVAHVGRKLPDGTTG